MGVFILWKHAAYLRRPCCTKSVGPCAPEVPAVRIMFRRRVCPCSGMAGECQRGGLIPMRAGIAEVSNRPDSALGPNVAGTGTLHRPSQSCSPSSWYYLPCRLCQCCLWQQILLLLFQSHQRLQIKRVVSSLYKPYSPRHGRSSTRGGQDEEIFKHEYPGSLGSYC